MTIKFLIIVLLCHVIVTCQSQKTKIDDITGKPMLSGLMDRSAFSDSAFSGWFNLEYENYSVNDSVLGNSENLLKECSISIVLGTWCPDSRREVPRFLKILDHLNFPEEKLTMIAVDRDKEDPEQLSENLSIDFVPTFIFYKSGKEIGRIIESPMETLEEDLHGIVNKND